MKSAWQTKALGDVCERVTVGHVGTTTPYYRDEGILFLRTQNVGAFGLALDEVKYITPEFHASLKKSDVKSGDILMSRVITHTVHCALIPHDLGPANCANVVLVRPGEGIMPEFLAHYIRSPQAQRHLLDRKVGSAQLVVNTTVVQNWPVPFPQLTEQHRIVGILDEAFEGIATAKANAEKNLQNARALFESHLRSVFTQRGEGWVEKRLDEFCTFSSGGTPSKDNSSYWDGGIPWVSGRDMKSTRLSDSQLHISRSAVEESATRIAPAGTLLILVRGMGLAHGAQIAELLAPCAFNQDIRGIHAEPGVIPRYLLFALRDQLNTSSTAISSAAHGTLKIDSHELQSLMIPIPRYEQQRAIVATIDAMAEETHRLENLYQRKLTALDALKKSLLHEAFSGRL